MHYPSGRFWLLAMGVAASTSAWSGDRVPPGYRAVAAERGVPSVLLYAVALAESGTRVDAALHPWPWTLNVAGEGRIFASRAAAWHDLRDALAAGERSIDIGVMQVNWRYHQQALQDPWQALDPYYNLRVAATILVDCYQVQRDWWDAVGCYHAPRASERAARYRERVRAHWRRLIAVQ
jgi:hypothetical protein